MKKKKKEKSESRKIIEELVLNPQNFLKNRDLKYKLGNIVNNNLLNLK